MLVVLATLLTAISAQKKGPCDRKLECESHLFETEERALCLAYKTCLKSTLAMTGAAPNAICNGAYSCSFAKVDLAPNKLLCNGFRACQKSRGIPRTDGVRAAEKVACNGAQACQNIVGNINAREITCDGSLACTQEKLEAEISVKCNGKKSCAEGKVSARDEVQCDGDVSCKDAKVTAALVGCGGKKACVDGLVTAGTVYAYGMAAIVRGTVICDGAPSCTVKALGFSGLVKAKIISSGTNLDVMAKGFRGMVGATVRCQAGSNCKVMCNGNACKKAKISVASGATLTMDPAECDPLDPNFVGPSKKDPSLPGKAFGVNCPKIIRVGGVPNAYTVTSDDELWRDADQYELDIANDPEVKEILDEIEAMDVMIEEVLAEEMAGYELMDAVYAEEEELVVEGHSIFATRTFGASNIMVTLAVVIMALIVSVCYYAYRHGMKGEYKPLIQK